MSTATQVSSWRAIEALRAGVPNRDAVQALGMGTAQPNIEARFRQMLGDVQKGFSTEEAADGMLVAGDFGAGKSHLLEYLQHVALKNNFVCSKVVISKETPLYNTAKVYNAAIQSAKVPDRAGTLLNVLAEKLDFESPGYERFYRWAFGSKSTLNTRLAASVFVFERGNGGRYPEVSDRILQFWGGNRVPESELKSWLRELGEVATYKFDKVSVRDLTLERYEFMSRLMVAAGYAGWVILVDEVELIGRYSILQRAKSYAEMARLLGLLEGHTVPGLASVFAITSAYQSEVMDEKQDEEKIASRLPATGKPEDLNLAKQAGMGMWKIRQVPHDSMVLHESNDLQDVYNKTRSVYSAAYHWEPPTDFEINHTWRIRQHIKRWINSWDLVRLFPEYTPDIQVTPLSPSYSEDLDLEESAEEDNSGWEG
ncbi:MAG: DUF2791 family P-loop domain-containing protein [Chloroflexi bacterium]|nr:DUF2791 family P-loop domain-containing protein [Chloroflexota bacterium]MDA1219657.1 DUF2791 family P-loop domain-containing protein [Chloroflexota bacterium]